MTNKDKQVRVVKRAGQHTVAVQMEHVHMHPLYGKRVVRNRRVLVHDPADTATLGQLVTIRPSRPHSRHKHWVIVQE